VAGELVFDYDRAEPLSLWTETREPPEHHSDLRALRFEFSSRGDRVPGRLLLPPRGDGPFPLALLQHGAGGQKEAPYLDATGGPWARAGAAVVSIDFPLHGERASPKFASQAASGGPLAEALAVQAVVDLRRALDAAQGLPGVDAGAAVFAGFSMGAMLGTAFCAADPRPRAAALALGGGGIGPAHLDPAGYVGRIAPRPLLFVNAERDETIPRGAAEAFYAAAGEPKQHVWFDGTHMDLPGAALKAMWEFLRPHLEL